MGVIQHLLASLGTSRLRHYLVAYTERFGGHIGYDIRPLSCRKGYGAVILSLTLQKARNIGLKKVLLTCDDDNTGSVKIIEKHQEG